MAAASRKGFFSGRTAVIAVPYLWLAIFFILPFVLVLKISLSETDIAIQLYTPTFPLGETWEAIKGFDFGAAWAAVPTTSPSSASTTSTLLTQDALYWKAYLSSLWIAAVSTVLLLLVGYPIAYGMARAPRTLRPTLLMLVILPFWTSFLIRVYAWIGILSRRPAQPGAGQDRPGRHRQSAQILNTRHRHLYRHRLFLSALHGAAALFGAGEDGRDAAGGSGGPRLSGRSKASGSSPSRCRCRAWSPAACCASFPPWANSSSPTCLGGSSTLMIGKTLWDGVQPQPRLRRQPRPWRWCCCVLLVVPIAFYQHVQTKQLEAGR